MIVLALISGIILAWLDYRALLAAAARAVSLDRVKAVQFMRWATAGRFAIVFLALAAGAMLLGSKAFIVYAIAFALVRASLIAYCIPRTRVATKGGASRREVSS